VFASPRNCPLVMRDFLLLSAGQFTSTLGDSCYAIALPWYLLSAHRSTILLGTVLACYGVPRTALIPVGGVLADRLGPRTVMMIADTGRCVLVAALVMLTADRSAALVAVGPLAALMGAGEGLFLPASFSILPSLVDGDQLTPANGYLTAVQEAGSLIGPAVGGAVVALSGPAPAFAIDAASFLISAATLGLIRGRRRRRPARSVAGGGIVSLLRGARVLRIILAVIVAANLALGGLIAVALPSLSHQRFGVSGYGAVLAILAAGTLIGSLIGTRSGRMRAPTVGATVAFLAATASMSVIPFAGGEPGAMAAVGAMGVGIGLGNAMLLPRLQAWAPAGLLGRVMSLIMLCSFGSFPLSVALTGVFVRQFGTAPFFPVAGACAAAVFGWALTCREWRTFGARPGAPAPAEAAHPAGAPGVVRRKCRYSDTSYGQPRSNGSETSLAKLMLRKYRFTYDRSAWSAGEPAGDDRPAADAGARPPGADRDIAVPGA
jgi:hypothetical protein